MEESLIIEVWDIFKEYISEKNRDTAANHYIDFLIGKDVDTSTLEGLMGYDASLDQAIELVVGEEADEAGEDDDWDSYEEDEEY
jgi:hypothetical protein